MKNKIYDPVGIRTLDPNFYIFGALKTQGLMMSMPGILSNNPTPNAPSTTRLVYKDTTIVRSMRK